MKPSDIATIQPLCSVYHRAQYEWVAQAIAQVLAARGNEWRLLTWEEYQGCTTLTWWNIAAQERYFKYVSPYLESEEQARSFSKYWNR